MEVSVIEKEKQFTAAEYLTQERKGTREKDGKYELHAGKLILKQGENKKHNTISVNLTGLLGYSLQNES